MFVPAVLVVLGPIGIAYLIGFAIGSRPWVAWHDVSPAEPAPAGPLWSVVRSQGLQGIGTGTRVTVDVEGDTLVVWKAGDSVASFPATGVRLIPRDEGLFELRAGTDEVAVLRPIDADPAALMAALKGAGP
jgi:hypothetical protein